MAVSTTKKTLRLFWQFTRPYPFLFWYGTIGVVFAVLLADVLPPLIIATAFNRMQELSAAGQPLTFATLQPYILLYIVSSMAGLFFWRTQTICTWKYSILSERRTAEYLFDHLQHMGSKFHADRFGGSLVSNVNKFTAAHDKFWADFTWNIVNGLTALIASLTILFLTNPLYAGIFSVITLVYFVIMFFLMRKQAPINRAAATSESERTAKLADNITNVGTVRAFAGEKQELNIFRKQTAHTVDAQFRLMRTQLRNENVSHSTITILNIMAFGVGIFAITRLNAQIGSLYLIVTYTYGLTERLWQAMFVMKNMNRSFGDAADMTEILSLGPEVPDPEQPEPARFKHGGIEFSDVAFGYSGNRTNKKLFKNLSFAIQPGEKIGLVGHSGGGKTTITKLLLRFMDIHDGQILIDGQNITAVTQADLRQAITYVPQEPLLFHRSLAENIAYGKPNATQAEIEAAAKVAHAHEFIMELSDGYDTLVGERGVKLSGGQRQRIAIARAMLKNAPILVLDEATSALDSESEKLIQDALWKLMESRTAIVIAHRLSTIQKMDRILVMEKGAVVEEGSHKELLQHNGIYASLWKHQSGGFLED
ncbi:MAG TPA: ABC transporter ATP-binding protein [Verrucomicrobiae bacterium]|nr:ABC transporter ATP-binding protein [Verrucomicrobiae bacterium]